MGIKFFDYDNDGRPDLFITDMHSDMFENVPPDREKQKAPVHPPEQILRRRRRHVHLRQRLLPQLSGGGRFEEISDRAGAENYWPWGPSVGDVNADGWDDIFIASSMNYPHRYGINSMLLNNRGEKFLDAEFLLGIEPRRGGRTHTPWFELDCLQEGLGTDLCRGQSGQDHRDGAARQPLVGDLRSRRRRRSRHRHQRLQFSAAGAGQRPGAATADSLAPGGAGRHASNRNGLGATVRVRAGGRVYTKYNDGKSGYLSQSALPLYFGLGDAERIERVEVDWPSGRKQVETQQLEM